MAKKIRCGVCKKEFKMLKYKEDHVKVRHTSIVEMPKNNLLSNAPEGKHFFVADGSVLRNVWDLVVKLDHLDEKTFKHHVNSERNDFGSWLKDVFKEEHVAAQIAEKRDRKEVQNVILKNLVAELSKKL